MRLNMGEWTGVAQQLGAVAQGGQAAAFRTVLEAGREIESDWRENATRTSGRRGAWYPKTITSEVSVRGPLHFEAEVAPRGSAGGGVGFEFGSRNQPPHLDGQKAAQVSEDRFPKRVDEWIGAMFR